MLENLIKLSHKFIKIKNTPYRRYFIQQTPLTHRMSIITGQRGVGKTTTLVQALLDRVNGDRFDPRILYIQADHFSVGSTSLFEIAEEFEGLGGQWLALDEIHKYPNWSKELKSMYDTFPSLTVFASGSSALEIYRGSHDLTRRAASFSMQGLSFREFLELTCGVTLPIYSLDAICSRHEYIADSILNLLSSKILPQFQTYLKTGYYPYFLEMPDETIYRLTLEQNLHTTIESDLAAIYPHLTGNSILKIKQLLVYIAEAVPFIPNWEKIKMALEISDTRTVKAYFTHLQKANLVRFLPKATAKFSKIESTAKVFLDNPNQFWAIAPENPNNGTVREAFFLSMLAQKHSISASKTGDFFVNNHFTFEVGGKGKTFNQIKSSKNAYLACDGIELGSRNKIPLWLFGFLY